MTKEELHSTITARAELDRAFARLLVEDAAEVMSKNLVSLLQVIERNHGEIMASLEVNAMTVKKLVEDVGNLQDRMAASERDRKDLRVLFETYISGSRRGEFDTLRNDVDDLKRARDDR